MPAMATPTRCPRCGRENDRGFAFCLDCGQALRGPPAAGAAAAVAPPLPASAAGRVRWRLTIVRNDGTPGRSFPVPRGAIVCGRREGDLRLPDDATVSPRHARFTRAPAALTVEDLGSANGTFVRLRTPRRLSAGEELRVGRQLLRLEPLDRGGAPGDAGARAWGSRDRGARYRLVQLLDGGGVGEVFPLREGENVVGREAGDVTFPSDRYVSGRHARLTVRGEEVTLADAGSSNGTFVRIAGPVELAPGDQLLVGTELLRVDG
jgi:pSer/pThr/pTyr-binding forkhead associated (FHA) protein